MKKFATQAVKKHNQKVEQANEGGEGLVLPAVSIGALPKAFPLIVNHGLHKAFAREKYDVVLIQSVDCRYARQKMRELHAPWPSHSEEARLTNARASESRGRDGPRTLGSAVRLVFNHIVSVWISPVITGSVFLFGGHACTSLASSFALAFGRQGGHESVNVMRE